LWERFALLTWWLQPGPAARYPRRADPVNALGAWRNNKIERGLLRHPNRNVRVAACETLVHGGGAQDECWDALSDEDRTSIDHKRMQRLEEILRRNRRYAEEIAPRYLAQLASHPNPPRNEVVEEMRLLTTINNYDVRWKACELFLERFPKDREHGCPASQPPPATIVTADGDVPL
jgi:hypothetical protein